MANTLEHNTKIIIVCMNLHNKGVDNGLHRISSLDRDVTSHDNLLPVQQDMVAYKSMHLKNKVTSMLRNNINDILKSQEFARPLANRKQLEYKI
jgi:hypothetical protein